jgi:hypothetical protein
MPGRRRFLELLAGLPVLPLLAARRAAAEPAQVFRTAGTWSVPPGTACVRVEIVGSGGGPGGYRSARFAGAEVTVGARGVGGRSGGSGADGYIPCRRCGGNHLICRD